MTKWIRGNDCCWLGKRIRVRVSVRVCVCVNDYVSSDLWLVVWSIKTLLGAEGQKLLFLGRQQVSNGVSMCVYVMFVMLCMYVFSLIMQNTDKRRAITYTPLNGLMVLLCPPGGSD